MFVDDTSSGTYVLLNIYMANLIIWVNIRLVLTWVCSSVLLDICGSTFSFTKACRTLMAFTTFCGHTGLFHEGHNVRRAGHSTILCHWALCCALLASLRGAQFQISRGDWHFRGFVICIFRAQGDKIRWLGGTRDLVWSLWLSVAASRLLATASFLAFRYSGINQLRGLKGQWVYV